MYLMRNASSRWISRALVSLVSASLLLLGAPALAEDVGLDIGGVTLLVPVEDGYVRVSERSPELHAYGQSNLPPTNRLVETFHTEANLATVLARGQTEGHYFMVQTMREIEPLTISHQEWIAGRDAIKQGMVNASLDGDGSGSAMRDTAGRKLTDRFDMIEAPVIYSEDPNSIRFLLKIADKAFTDAGNPVLTGAAGAIVHVHDKIVFVYWYARPATSASMEVARQKLDAAVDRMVQINAATAASAPADAVPKPAAEAAPETAPETIVGEEGKPASSVATMIMIFAGLAIVIVVGLLLLLRSRGRDR